MLRFNSRGKERARARERERERERGSTEQSSLINGACVCDESFTEEDEAD
jgi:hypothetical protein